MMKKFLLSILALMIALAAVFAYILYTEGFFDKPETTPKSDMKPFEMKCEAGKCGAGKCGSAN